MFVRVGYIFFIVYISYLQENLPIYNFIGEKADLGEVEECGETLTASNL